MHPPTALVERILGRVAELPVIDCHEHMVGPAGIGPLKEPIAALIVSYLPTDLLSAGLPLKQLQILQNPGHIQSQELGIVPQIAACLHRRGHDG